MDLSDYEENWTDNNNEEERFPLGIGVFFIFSDGTFTSREQCCVETLIKSEEFKKLDDNDASFANDRGREGWDKSILGLACMANMYQQLKDAMLDVAALYGQLPVERLVPDEIKARSRWWVSSRAYFDRRNIEDERIPRHLNRNNYFEVPSEMYREFEKQRRGYKKMMEKSDNMYEKMSRFIEDMRVGPVPQANREPIIANQHYGISDLSGFQSNRNICDRARREHQPSVYMLSPYTVLPPTTELPKKRTDKTKKKGKAAKLSPLNLGNTFVDENVSGEDVTITGVQQTDNYFFYENVDPDKVTRDAYVTMAEFILNPYDIYLDCYMKGYKLPSFFWPQLVPHLCTYRSDRSWPEGWLSSDHMNSWIQILIRERAENDNWTLSKSGTICLHPENNSFMILTDPHIIGTLDGSMRPYPSWKNVNWVYIPINAQGVHWVTGAINLADSIFYVFDSMESESRMLMLEQQVRDWTPVINRILLMRGSGDTKNCGYD
ncbi:phospholipase-like protein [Tanacetum coccineum]